MSKAKTVRGTKPTFIQRRLLENSHKNPEEWMYVKEVIRENTTGKQSRSLSRNSSKTRLLQFIHRTTGEVIELPWPA